METVKEFAAKSHISEKLIRAVVRQIGGCEEFQNRADDVTNHGAAGGFSGFTYYSDTVEFTNEIGEDGVISFIAGFGCMKGTSQEEIADGLYNPRSDMRTTIYNALAWFALEEVCRSYSDLCYDARNN